ncbi:unnamed protein product [Eruca vesicaria subsp. sativa]|uniref:Nucleolar complex protein 3 homolog n=1 Tax=Eruca vesicaria subsp. sativa TaxID=29727 RepID=A0ABC8JJ59_ERUVS|nr:unnamed protein product [Eruca vesicaria subsp. sativa]
MGKSRRKEKKVIPPPQLPPDVGEEEIEFSDEDVEFVKENKEYARFVSRIDTTAINRQCVGEAKTKTVEDKYEEERSKKKVAEEEKESNEIQVDPVDVLPVKTLDGKLHYRTVTKRSKLAEAEPDEAEEDVLDDENVLNKSQRRAKAKKSKKEAKKQGKEVPKEIIEEEETPQAAVLAEVKEELSAEETFENKKNRLAELGMQLLSDPEAHIRSLKEMLDISKEENAKIVKLCLLSVLAVFKDIIPGYRIRLPTEKELEMKVSKEVKKTRFYESTLLKAYKSYLQKLVAFERQPVYSQVANRCICTLLDAKPHFNYRDNLLSAVVGNISSPDEVIRRLCCSTVRSLFLNEGKHGGELTVQAVRLIADQVKSHNCQLHPNSIEVFMSIRFDEDIGKRDREEANKKKFKKNDKRNNQEEQNQVQENERKKSKREMMSKIRDEVNADYKGVTYEPDAMERRKMQTVTLSAVFETYFRILRKTMYSIGESSTEEDDTTLNPGAFGPHPLLAPCLDGLAKFTQQLDLDYLGDLMNYLKKLASSSSLSTNLKKKKTKLLTVSERLRCCLVAFKVMRSNLNALNVDLQDFFVQLYNLILEYRPGRDSGEVLAESLKIMLCDDRHQDMQKAAAFVKRLATFALCFGCAESMSALVTLKNLLQRNVKCRNLLENDVGGGSVSGSIAKYQPYATDPNLSGAFASVLWELNLLTKHYHPAISTLAGTIANMNTSQNQTFLSAVTPQQAFADYSLANETFEPKSESRKLNTKRKRDSGGEEGKDVPELDMGELKKKLKENFTILRGIKEDERVRMELQFEKKKPTKKQSNLAKKKPTKSPKSKKKI